MLRFLDEIEEAAAETLHSFIYSRTIESKASLVS